MIILQAERWDMVQWSAWRLSLLSKTRLTVDARRFYRLGNDIRFHWNGQALLQTAAVQDSRQNPARLFVQMCDESPSPGRLVFGALPTFATRAGSVFYPRRPCDAVFQ